MLRGLIQSGLILGAAALMGCTGSMSAQTVTNDSGGSDQAQLASFAARASYPGDVKPNDDWRAAAIVSMRDSTIKIYNFSDRSFNDVRVWVDGNYVQQVGLIPAHGSVVVDEGRFYDRSGNRMSQVRQTPTRVEVEAGGKLYSLMGPVVE